MSHSLLVAIDVQKGFINQWTGQIPARIEDLQGRFDRVTATRFVNPEGSAHRKWLHWDRFAPGSEDAGLAFAPRQDAEIIDKSTYTCVTPKFVSNLKLNNIATVHLAGIATDNCILKSAVDLFEAGLRPVVLAFACASHGGPEAHACALLLLKRFIGAGQVMEADPGEGWRPA
ncbi:MAG: cysteine hydrolase [Rhodospirillales bacterium]|nr:cysteine hydrolase [Rhodospirillales bacterium]